MDLHKSVLEERSPPFSAGAGAIPTWKVDAGAGVGSALINLVPGPGLAWREGGPSQEWAAKGERSTFTVPLQALSAGTLPAGWYELSGCLLASDGNVMPSCLRVGYLTGADGDAEIALPDPDASGRIHTLVLFKYGVASLHFCPGRGLIRFRMGGFVLRRVSRARAFSMMLSGVGGRVRRLSSFIVRALNSGLGEATRQLFEDYRQRVLPSGVNQYARWALRYDTITSERMTDLQMRAERLSQVGPKISILLPTYQTPEPLLRRCLESVQAQAYPNWQLCVADDASPDVRVIEILDEYARSDARICVKRRKSNGHISAASNTALESATGDYIALLDHDDELRPHALLEMAEVIVANPEVELLYSDEDKIDMDGRRFDPYFKPDWDPDLLRSQNYLCHLTCIRIELARAVGGFREGFEGSQDHDLVLRCSERLSPELIRHIPKVLYHWRAIPGSTALTRDAKDYASSAGAKAVNEHLERCHPGARVEELSHGHYRVHWPLPRPLPKVSLVIPTRDRVELLRMCVQSILERTSYGNFEIVVVDNQSSDPRTLAYLAELECNGRVRVRRYDAPFNYSAINNWAVAQCDGDIVGLINNDIEIITPEWLEEMASHALRPDVGAVGAMLYYPDDTIQHAGVLLGVHGVAAHRYVGMPRGYPGHGGRARVAQCLSAVTGACLVVRRELYRQMRGLDESLQVAFNDIDFCLRLREAGYRNIWTPFAELYHHESASRGSEDTEEKKQRFASEVEFMQRRWAGQLHNDPAYNVNLSLASRCSELSIPPRQ